MAPRPKKIDWIGIEGDYLAGQKSIRAIAEQYNSSESGIRKRAKQKGWVRDATGKKREMVKAALSGTSDSAQSGVQYAVRTIEEAAKQDVADMHNGLEVARLCIAKLRIMTEVAGKPQEIKTIVDANKGAIETIRRIRGLDDPNASTHEDDLDKLR